jgi:hypothetical protein
MGKDGIVWRRKQMGLPGKLKFPGFLAATGQSNAAMLGSPGKLFLVGDSRNIQIAIS